MKMNWKSLSLSIGATALLATSLALARGADISVVRVPNARNSATGSRRRNWHFASALFVPAENLLVLK